LTAITTTDISAAASDRDTVSDRTWLDAAIVGGLTTTVAVAAGLVVVSALVLLATYLIRQRSNRTGSSSELNSPTAILEEMRKRLEDLPTLPQFATPADEELPLHNPFSEPSPPPSAITAPGPLPVRRSAPPLPTDAEDPVTGRPDEAAYRAWLKEWLIYAEQYGDEASDDMSSAGQAGQGRAQ